MEHAIELFAIFGGLDAALDTGRDVEHLIEFHILRSFEKHRQTIFEPLEENPLLPKLLNAIAVGDRRGGSAFRRARIGKERGQEGFTALRSIGYLKIEHSRETPLIRTYPKQRFKKEIERHRISHKYRFATPFLRFWFGFIHPFESSLRKGDFEPFFNYFRTHFNAFVGFVYEELCDQFICEILSARFADRVIESGSYWDREVEIDLLSDTLSGETWIGECKWTNHKRGKKELRHLEEKWIKLSLSPDKIFLFSKRGFSNELQTLKYPNLYLFDAEDMIELTRLP